MHHVGGEKTAVAGAQFAGFAADFGQCAALEHVADLFYARVGVRQSAFALLNMAKHQFDLLCTGFGTDQALVQRAGVIGRVVAGDVLLPDKIIVGHAALLYCFQAHDSL